MEKVDPKFGILNNKDFAEGRSFQRERTLKEIRYWISEYRGHDGECDCRIKAEALEHMERWIKNDR